MSNSVARFLGAVLLLSCTALAAIAQPERQLDSTSQVILENFERHSAKNDSKNLVAFYRAHINAFRYDDVLFQKAIESLLQQRKYDAAIEVLKFNPFLISQHNQQALLSYYRAVADMLDPRGWPHLKVAEKRLKHSAQELRRSWAPDYGFYSDIENALGYINITARGMSTDSIGSAVCIVRWDNIYQAISHFRNSLVYNPENDIAQSNLDTLLALLETFGKPIPPHQFEVNAVEGRKTVSVDSLNADSLNNTSILPVLDYSLLPRNYALILGELHQYDEIVLLIDLSGSMDDPVDWSAEASKFRIAHELSLYIAMNLRVNVYLGALTVGRECDVTSMVLNYPIGSASRHELAVSISSMTPRGHTPLDRRLLMTKDMFSDKVNKKLVFLLSDGMDTCGDIPDLCGTAALLAANGIDLSVFSFINETLDEESRSAYAIYQCMVRPTTNRIYKINQTGGVADEIDYEPVSNNILRLPPMDTSALWQNNPVLFQFPISRIELESDHIIRFRDQ